MPANSRSRLVGEAPPKGGGEAWLSLRGRYVPVGRCPAADAAAETERWTVPTGHQRPPATFEKVDETFTRLRRARELIIRTGVSVAHRPKARLARGATPAHAS